METSMMAQSESCTTRSGAQELENELLAEIFSYLCCDPIDLGASSAPVLDLQRVCVHWRTVARSTPWLWATFIIRTIDEAPSIRRRMDTCLKLSGSALITVDLITLFTFPAPSYHSDRWGTLYTGSAAINGILEDRPKLHSAIKQRGLGRLRKLVLEGMQLKSDPPYPFDFFDSAVGLEEISMSDIEEEEDVVPPNFPWAKLKRLEMSDCHFRGDNISFFRSLSSLEELVWTRNLVPLKSLPQGLVVTLPALHSIMIDDNDHCSRANNVPLQWSLYRTPALTNVHLVNDMPHFEHLSNMILTSSGVKTLQLELCYNAFFCEVVQLLPRVEELTITDAHELDDTLKELVWDPSRKTNLLPSLRKLSIFHSSEDLRTIQPNEYDFSVTTLMERLKSYSSSSISASLLKVLSSRITSDKVKDCQDISKLQLPASPLMFVKLNFARFPQSLMRLIAKGEKRKLIVK